MSQDPRMLLQQADKTYSSAGSGFSLFGGKQEKYERASELYMQAANAFRLAKDGTEAGKAFERAAMIQNKHLNEPMDGANTLTEAYKAYRKTDPEDAARCIDQAINHYTMNGNFRRAATHKQNQAELYELDLHDTKRALEAYDTAAGWYESDGAGALANKLFLKVGDLSAQEADYPKAVENFERVAKSSIDNNLMKWSVKDYLLKAGICHLASGDMVATKRAMESYTELDPQFGSTRECLLLNDLIETIDKGDQEAFADKLFQYDQVSKLDKWKTMILLRIKEGIAEQEEDFS